MDIPVTCDDWWLMTAKHYFYTHVNLLFQYILNVSFRLPLRLRDWSLRFPSLHLGLGFHLAKQPHHDRSLQQPLCCQSPSCPRGSVAAVKPNYRRILWKNTLILLKLFTIIMRVMRMSSGDMSSWLSFTYVRICFVHVFIVMYNQ